jgi:peptidoglycan biosynthesis protein MviN/MurJ (putative lipid II flippase)
MLWVGKDNVASPTIFVAFSVTIILQVLVHSSLIISYGTNRMNSVSKASLVEGVFKIVISLLLLHHLGTLGVALGSIFAQLCITAWYIPLSACKITGDSLPEYALRIFLPTLPAAIITVILGTIVIFVVHDPWHLLLTGVPLTITIYLLIYMAQGMGNDEQSWTISKTRHFFGK